MSEVGVLFSPAWDGGVLIPLTKPALSSLSIGSSGFAGVIGRDCARGRR